MEILGKVKVVSDVIQVTDSFKKRELVVTTDEQYPQSILIEFTQDKSDLLNGLVVGQEVKVHINIGGREWVNPQGETKYFNSIKGWRIEKVNTEQTNNIPTPEEVFAPAVNHTQESEGDGLPF